MSKKNPNKRSYWKTDIDTAIKIAELAVKEKITMQEAFNKLIKSGEIKPEYLGDGEMDGDLLAGNLREEGIRVFNVREKKNKEQ